jgi:hypothetical protein
LPSKEAAKPGTTWNLENPVNLVKANLKYSELSDARRTDIDPVLSRIDDAIYSTSARIEYAVYHHFEAERLQKLRKRRIRRSDSPERAKMMYQVEHPMERIAAAASVVACLQNAHAIFDLFMFGAYFALYAGSVEPLLQPRSVTWTKVEQLLSKRPELGAVLSRLQALRADVDFKYLDALVNSSKHRAVIKTKHYLVVDYEIDEESAPKFDSFEFNGEHYPMRDALPFTRKVCNLMKTFIVDAGQELDAALNS